MKIFSLETKKHVVLWGIAAGFFVNWFVNIVTKTKEACPGYLSGDCPTVYYQGWAIKVTLDTMKVYGDEGLPLVANLILWILVGIIIFFLIRYFKYKKQ